MTIALAVRLRVRSDPAGGGPPERARRALAALAVASREEPGCLVYEVQQSRDDANEFLVYEQYLDDAAFDQHRQSPHFARHFTAELAPDLEAREAKFYQVIETEPGDA
jgi:quinol monooxygenase YgiN